MTCDFEPRRSRDGSIDLAYYKARAERFRQEALIELMGYVFRPVIDWRSGLRHSCNQPGAWVHKASSQEKRRGVQQNSTG